MVKQEKKVGDWIVWYALLGEIFTGQILADEGDEWLVRRDFGGVCLVSKLEVW